MENFIKKNWFKISIIGILLVVVLSLLYYFVIYLPDKSANEYAFQQLEKCKTLGDNFIEQHVKPDGQTSFLVDSESHFNKKLNTCLLYYEERFHLNTLLENSYVVNIFTGKPLLEKHLRGGEPWLGKEGALTSGGRLSQSDFESQKQKLMNE